MKKFVAVFSNELTAEENQAHHANVGAAQMEWFGKLGDRLLERNVFAPGAMHVTFGSAVPDTGTAPEGYFVFEAESMEAATELAKECPMINVDTASMTVYQRVDAPFS